MVYRCSPPFQLSWGSGVLNDCRIAREPSKQARTLKQERLRSFSFRSRSVCCDKIIVALAVAFLLVGAWFHLAAVRVPGRDRLKRARHLVAVVVVVAAPPSAAVAAVAVVALAVA